MPIRTWPPDTRYIPAGTIVRADLAEDSLQAYGIPLQTLKNADGSSLAAAAAAGKFGLLSGGYGTGTLTLDGEAASGNAKTSTAMFEFTLPPEYIAAGSITLRVTAYESVGAATVSTTYSCEVYKSDGKGAVGSDISAAPSATDITTTWQTITSVVTPTGLVVGNRLVCFIRLVSDDSGAAVGTVHQIGSVEMLLDVKG